MESKGKLKEFKGNLKEAKSENLRRINETNLHMLRALRYHFKI